MGLTKAQIVSEVGTVTAQFNPKELQVDKTVSWTAKNSHKEDPIQEFKEPQSASLAVTLYFDGFETGTDVSGQVKSIEKTAKMTGSGHPPMVRFVWGSFVFEGVTESVSMKYTMFLPSGAPCRAEVGFKMKSAVGAEVSAIAGGDPGADGA
jgi:hypothetical protein